MQLRGYKAKNLQGEPIPPCYPEPIYVSNCRREIGDTVGDAVAASLNLAYVGPLPRLQIFLFTLYTKHSLNFL